MRHGTTRRWFALAAIAAGAIVPLRGRGAEPVATAPVAAAELCTVSVMILADTDEPRASDYWERQIRQRMAAASAIFERQCRVRFQVVAVGQWTMSPGLTDFEQSLREFERKVRPGTARLAVGFTSRFRWTPGERHMGGTRGLLASHILVRDAYRNVSETERLEVLVHELGHFLGARHTADRTSVMRPKLGDGQSRAARFRIQFDAENLRAMALVGEALRHRPAATPRDFAPETLAALRDIYNGMAKDLPSEELRKVPGGP